MLDQKESLYLLFFPFFSFFLFLFVTETLAQEGLYAPGELEEREEKKEHLERLDKP